MIVISPSHDDDQTNFIEKRIIVLKSWITRKRMILKN